MTDEEARVRLQQMADQDASKRGEFVLSKQMYKEIKHGDRTKFDKFYRAVFSMAFKDGFAAGSRLTRQMEENKVKNTADASAIYAKLCGIPGIGPKLQEKIREVLEIKEEEDNDRDGQAGADA